MQPNQSIIVYRSQTEANQDMCIQMAFQYCYDHSLVILTSIFVIAMSLVIYKKLADKHQ